MKNEVYGTIELTVSVDVKSDNEKMAMEEVEFKYGDSTFYEFMLYGVDRDGNLHKFEAHDFTINWAEFIN